MKWLVLIIVLALPALSLAASGDSCGTLTPPAGTSPGGEKGMPTTCIKLIDDITVAADSSVIWVPVQQASHVVIKVVSANNSGAACTFDEWALYESWTSTTPAVTNTFGPLCAFDDDGTTALVGVTASAECKIFGPVGPYIFVDAGTLGACATDFSIWAWFYAPVPPQ